jgi:hypothetical protein
VIEHDAAGRATGNLLADPQEVEGSGNQDVRNTYDLHPLWIVPEQVDRA